MSNIEQNLQKILSTRFGKDVRQAIHDGIHDCYEDGKAGAVDLVARERIDNLSKLEPGSTTGDAELIDGRVDYTGKTWSNIGESIRNVTRQLSEENTELKGNIDKLNEGGLNLKDEVIVEDVNNWLDEHPEATTTVMDGSITESKINSDLLPYIKNGYVTPEMYGAVGDGENDDTNYLLSAFNNDNKLPVLLRGTYKVSTLNIETSINICGGTIISDSIAMIYDTYVRESKIKNVTFIAKNTCLEIKNSDHISIENCTFKNAENGVRITGGVECKMLNCYITCDEIGGSVGVGLFINSSDGEYNNINIVDYKTGVSVAGYNVLNTIHPWTWNVKVMLNSVAFHCRQGCRSVITNCYCDSFEYGIFFENSSYMTISKLFFFWNNIVFSGKKIAFLFNDENIARLVTISDINVNSDDDVLFSNIGYPENNENKIIQMNRCFIFNNTLREPFKNMPTNEPVINSIRKVYNINSYLIKDFCVISMTFTPVDSDLNKEITIAELSPIPIINFHAKFVGNNNIADASIIAGVIKATFKEVDDYIINIMYKF